MSCPLCGSVKTKQIITQRKWSIKACQICTNAWTDPPPNQVDYHNADFHANVTASEDEDGLKTVNDLPEQWKYSVFMQTQLLVRHLHPKARILEIGCGEGILLKELSSLGFDVQGIEPSESGSLRARKKGLDVITGYFPDPALKAPFDAVILSHVLEHLANPLEILEQVKKMVPHGHLLLVQSHYKGLIPLWNQKNWYAWAVNEHFWHFTPKGLIHITHNSNFHPVVYEFSSLVHYGRLAKIIDRFLPSFPPLLDQFHLLLKIGNSAQGLKS